MTDDLAYTVSEAAATARISRALLYRHIADGKIMSRKLGSRTIILRQDLIAYLQAAPASAARKPT